MELVKVLHGLVRIKGTRIGGQRIELRAVPEEVRALQVVQLNTVIQVKQGSGDQVQKPVPRLVNSRDTGLEEKLEVVKAIRGEEGLSELLDSLTSFG